MMIPLNVLSGFELDAEIAMSELRSEETLTDRLHRYPALRLRRRNDLLAILVTPQRWKEIQETIAELESKLEAYEHGEIQAIIADRAPKAAFTPATEAVWNDITRQFKDLTS